MATAYEAVDMVCPFYEKSDKYRIVCEGAEEGSTIQSLFGDSKRCAGFKHRFCKSEYTECRIYRMLCEKY